MTALAALTIRVRDAIPLTRSLGFEYHRWRSGELLLSAPLALNYNDKGTFFAGSQAALFTLAGWSLATLEGQPVAGEVDVVAVETSLDYRKPLTSDMQIRVFADTPALEAYAASLRQKGRGRLRVSAEALNADGELASAFNGLYLARKNR